MRMDAQQLGYIVIHCKKVRRMNANMWTLFRESFRLNEIVRIHYAHLFHHNQILPNILINEKSQRDRQTMMKRTLGCCETEIEKSYAADSPSPANHSQAICLRVLRTIRQRLNAYACQPLPVGSSCWTSVLPIFEPKPTEKSHFVVRWGSSDDSWPLAYIFARLRKFLIGICDVYLGYIQRLSHVTMDGIAVAIVETQPTANPQP